MLPSTELNFPGSGVDVEAEPDSDMQTIGIRLPCRSALLSTRNVFMFELPPLSLAGCSHHLSPRDVQFFVAFD